MERGENREEKTGCQGDFVLVDKKAGLSRDCCLREKGPLSSVLSSDICFTLDKSPNNSSLFVFLEMRLK